MHLDGNGLCFFNRDEYIILRLPIQKAYLISIDIIYQSFSSIVLNI